MSKNKIAICGTMVVLALISGFFSVPAIAATPVSCDVKQRSQKGGEVHLVTIDKSPDLPLYIPLQISWTPASSQRSVALHIKYQGSTLSGLNFPSGGYIRILIPVEAQNDKYEATITSKKGGKWHYLYPNDFSAYKGLADIILDKDDDRGGAILSAINNDDDISIIVLHESKIIAFADFKTSEKIERDKLLSKAGKVLETQKTKVCQPV